MWAECGHFNFVFIHFNLRVVWYDGTAQSEFEPAQCYGEETNYKQTGMLSGMCPSW